MTRTFASYELKAEQAVGNAAGPGMFYSPEDPGEPRWVMNQKNIAAFESVVLRPRVMLDVSTISLSTEVCGQSIAFPVMLAPAGYLNRYSPEGELAAARAANSVGTIMTVSTASAFSMEDVAQAVDKPMWFQLYPMKDRKLTEHLVQRAEAAGFSTLVVTIDNPGTLPKEWDLSEQEFGNFNQGKYPNVPLSRIDFLKFRAADFQWTELEWLRSISNLRIILKGVQTAEDAAVAARCGLSGVIVSNHGGHTIPGIDATIRLLPEVADVAGELEVYLDGGVRSGSDVLKAVALGARAVLIGRPMIWGLIVNGESGVREVLEAIRDELRIAMGYCGVTDIRRVDRSLARVGCDCGRGPSWG